MGAFGQHYKVNVGYTQSLRESDYTCTIVSAKEQVSKSGKPMVAIELSVENNGVIRYFLVDDRSDPLRSMLSDVRITRFFDCFNIRRGLFNFNAWIGKKGLVHIGKGKPDPQGYVYPEVKKLYTKEEAKMIISGPEENDMIEEEANIREAEYNRSVDSAISATNKDEETEEELNEAVEDIF